MIKSTDRILTTHVGCLQRPPTVTQSLVNEVNKTASAGELLKSAVAEVVRAQVETGIDIINDGEFGKSIWQWYVTERLTGLDRQPYDSPLFKGRDREEFGDFYQYADKTPGVLFYGEDAAFWGAVSTQPVCVGPISYLPAAVDRDIANLKAALEGVNNVTEVFMPVVAPVSAEIAMANKYYANDKEFRQAIAEAIKEEYRAIVDAGFMLQVDDAWIPALWDREANLDLTTYRNFCASCIEVLNYALTGIPEDRVRYHLCWGSWHGPHVTDVPLAEVIDPMLQVKEGTYGLEAANPRHEHEYHLWETVKLPEGKVIAPGVVTHSTNVVEHPELVAERIIRFAERVGRENVIASTDCGMGARIHPQLGWAKLKALSEGAKIASTRLWG